MHSNNAVLLPLDSEAAPDRPMTLIDMLLKHEARIQDIESGMDRLSTMTDKTNHHLANMRTSLALLESITMAVDKIEGAVSKSETDFQVHKVLTGTSIKHMTKQIDSVGAWIKWGVTIGFSTIGLFMVIATTLKIWGA